MKEEEFWRCTPRKLFALADVHIKMMSPENKEKQEPQRLTLEELMKWR